jgi:hypothetical protein
MVTGKDEAPTANVTMPGLWVGRGGLGIVLSHVAGLARPDK